MNAAARTTMNRRRLGYSVAVFALAALLSGASADVEAPVHSRHVQLVGTQECTYGPSFWCKNLTNAAGCKAVKHCIQSTWETHKYPEDNDDVCTICKNMVKEARDTLTSNATLDELQQVFYGSCQLLPLKVVKAECKKLADDFIPELVDTLASEMDPNVVCTVAGLCNNAHIDKLLLENKEKGQPEITDEPHSCEQCAVVMNKVENLVQTLSEDEVINKIIMMCGELSSFSDSCSNTVIKYRKEIYDTIKTGFTKRNICILSGMCSEAFHPHADGYEKSKNALMGVEISSAGERGRIQIQKPNEVSDELTCEFCEALVKHLRDILISNTTKEQFLDVLNGLCKQTKSFSDECLSFVDTYYTHIYEFLTNELNGKKLCGIVGICPNSIKSIQDINNFAPMFPLIRVDLIQSPSAIKDEEVSKKSAILIDEQPPKVINVKQPTKKSPIIDLFYKDMHVVVNDVDMPTEKTVCFVCQSILNYIQQVVTDPKSESKIRSAMEKFCEVVPSSFRPQCVQFIDQYGDAFISLIAQEADPSIICPELKLCPALDLSLTPTINSESSDNCPLCVIFMSALEKEITNKDTEAMIKAKLEKLCSKMPSNWKAQCTNFVEGEFQSILDLLVAEVKPEEICVMLNVCKPKSLSDSTTFRDTENNMVAVSEQVTVVFPEYDMGKLLANNYKMLEEPEVPTPFCLICTVVMKYLNSAVKDKVNQESIERVLDETCSVLPNVEETECQTFVNTHYAQIVQAIQIGTDPGVACMALMVCNTEDIQGDVFQGHIFPVQSESSLKVQPTATESVDLDTSNECVACEAFTKVLGDRMLSNSKNNDMFIMDVTDLCNEIDVMYKDQCVEMTNSYGQSIMNLYYEVPAWKICEEIALCGKNKSVGVTQIKNPKCLEGVKYWCASVNNAKECKAESVCDGNMWKLQVVQN